MPINHLLPFVLPRGRDKDTGRLTVYLSPRLKERARLNAYPVWRDWPAALRQFGVEIRVNGIDASPRVVGVPASSAVWRAVFSRETPVQPHRFIDFAKTPLLPMASSDFSEAILELYLRMARLHPEGPPGGDELVAIAGAAGLDLGSADEPGSLAEAAAYRSPMTDAVDLDEPVDEPEFDFHASLSLLGHHPELLRHLGLAVDFEVDLPPIPNEVTASVNGFAGGGFGPGTETFEAALVTRTGADFLALPNPTAPEQSGGFLSLAAEKAFLSIVDPNLAAARLSAAADLAVEQDEGALPALATRALTLVRPDLTRTYVNRFIRQAQLEDGLPDSLTVGGTPVVLFAEDMTIGHRIDVLDQGTWRSLFQRRSEAGYVWPPAEELPTIVPAPDEGWHTTMLVTEQQDRRGPINEDRDDPVEPTALFRLDDAMYRWNGWSGAAPPIGSVLDSATGLPKAVEPSAPETETDPVQLAVDYQVVPGSLPRLRFGRTYQMRARCVDLAGNSQPLAAIESAAAVAPPEIFGRLEPIAAPSVVRRTPRPTPGVGDTPDELVLLSDPDLPDQLVRPVERLLFPGRVGQDLVELHGLPAGGADPGSYAELAARDALDLTDQTVADPVTGELVAAADVRGTIEPGPTRQEVGYLSDPAIGGLRFGFPSLGTEASVPIADTWPKRQTARLVVAAGKAPVAVQPDAETDLAVFVPKAEIVPVDASHAIAAGLVDHFALWQRLTEGEQDQLRAQVLGGAHWMFSPARSLRLVHAVRRPLLAPSVSALAAAERSLGSSAVVLDGSLLTHRKSTERVVMTGSWTDTVDDLAESGPVPQSTSVVLGDLLVTRSEKNEVAVESLRAELHDTKRHLATVDLEAYTSFAGYFTEEKVITPQTNRVLIDARGVAAGTVAVTVVATGEQARLGVDFTVNGSTGRLVILPRGILAVGQPITVRYVALPISRVSAETGRPAFTILFENTIVPPPPAVAEVIPAFARTADGSHSGQVLRVYLDRPWLVTGDGEQLAVIVDPDGSASTVGRDPIVPGSGRTATLSADDFPRAITVLPSLDGLPAVVGHAVSFDTDSGRWFSDIELGPGFGYRPFLRLVVARFQPDSIPGATLSPFVSLEPVRLGVVRETEAVRRGNLIDVVIKGTKDLDNQIQATLQQVDKTISDPHLRWQPVGEPVRLDGSGTDDAVWSGTLDLDGTAGELRVVIEELEPGLREENKTVTDVETVVFVEVVEL